MRIKVFTLPFHSSIDGFDDNPMRNFLADKNVVLIREHFFTKNDKPYLAIIACYHQTIKEEPIKNKKKNRDEWKQHLDETDIPLFNTLREWRSERAKTDGVAPYIVFDNVQLARVAKNRPESVTGLQAIVGIGKGKSEKYRDDILKIISATMNINQKDKKHEDKTKDTESNEPA